MPSRPPPPDFGKERTSWSDLDRPDAPDARESDTESAWAEFHALSQPSDFSPTQPASIPMPLPEGDPRYATTVPGALLRPTEPAPLAPTVHHVTIEQATNESRRNNRICPQPQEWQQLYHMLPGKKQMSRGSEPQAPLTGSAWGVTTDMAKRMCLRDHLEWAERKGCLDEIFAFLKSLPEEGWYHAGE
jgi:hypothetical protein